jgi:hypothetical protein
MARPRSSVSFARPGSLIPSLGRLAGRYYLCDNNYAPIPFIQPTRCRCHRTLRGCASAPSSGQGVINVWIADENNPTRSPSKSALHNPQFALSRTASFYGGNGISRR